jgi:hypothetical protein
MRDWIPFKDEEEKRFRKGKKKDAKREEKGGF